MLKEDRVQNIRNIIDGSNFKPEDKNEIDKSIKHKQSDTKNKKNFPGRQINFKSSMAGYIKILTSQNILKGKLFILANFTLISQP